MVTAHADHVGSLLRPPELLDARRAHAAGELDPPAFKAVEDRAVLDVIRLQEDAGLPVVTDGELRRESFQSELVAAVEGFEGVTIDAWLWGAWHSDELDAVREPLDPGAFHGRVSDLRRLHGRRRRDPRRGGPRARPARRDVPPA